METAKRLLFACPLILLVACSEPERPKPEPHTAIRETKAYERVNLDELTLPALIGHLRMLNDKTRAAVESEQLDELHYLQVSLTNTLSQIQSKVFGRKKAAAKPSIESMKILAIRLHDASHQENFAMAESVLPAFKTQTQKLAVEVLR